MLFADKDMRGRESGCRELHSDLGFIRGPGQIP